MVMFLSCENRYLISQTAHVSDAYGSYRVHLPGAEVPDPVIAAATSESDNSA